MSASRRVPSMMLAGLLLAACAPQQAANSTPDPRLTGQQLAAACADRDGWSDPAPPARIHGNTYYVGTCGISVLLVTSRDGHVLVDGATDEAAPAILANIRTLGFDPRDVRFIVGSHEHLDHMGGFAALKAATGARLLVSAAARPVVESGAVDADDPQAGDIPGMRPVAIDGTLAFVPDADMIRVAGPTRVLSLLPHFTPGHTSGGTSWTWQSCEGRDCRSFAYIDSLSAVSRDGYRFTDHPGRVAPFRTTFAQVRRMPCDILVTPHPSASNLFERLAGRAPLVDATACARLADASEARLDARLAREAAQR